MRLALCGLACLAVAGVLLTPAPSRIVVLPEGIVQLSTEMQVGPDTEVRGSPLGTTLEAAPDFNGRALIVCSGKGIKLQDFTIDGNRTALERPTGLPPYDRAFAEFTRNNGILAHDAHGLRIAGIRIRQVVGFAILIARSNDVSIDSVTVLESGGRNERGRNNTTGGVLLEEGSRRFRVTRCTLTNVRGNGIWTHSLYTSPRNGPGTIAGNRFRNISRDAIQAGHATGVTVVENTGTRIGFPVEYVDVEGHAIPVAIDTAGNVDRSIYARNRFEEVNGKCFDLDGFHHGEIRDNVCLNTGPPERYPNGNYGIVMNNTNPDMRSAGIRLEGNSISGMLFGGIFVIGTGHIVSRNVLLDLNTSHCNESAARFGCYYATGEPDMLRSGIYLGRGAERPAPAQGNLIEDNEIRGFRMAERCIGLAPGIGRAANTIRRNRCADGPPGKVE